MTLHRVCIRIAWSVLLIGELFTLVLLSATGFVVAYSLFFTPHNVSETGDLTQIMSVFWLGLVVYLGDTLFGDIQKTWHEIKNVRKDPDHARTDAKI